MSNLCSRRDILASVGVAVAGCATGANQPEGPEAPGQLLSQWPVPNADIGRSNSIANAAGPTEKPAELWGIDTATEATKPVVVDGAAFVGTSDGSVQSLDARTGEENWQTTVGTTTNTPWATGDFVIISTEKELVALQQVDGSEVWRVDTNSRATVLGGSHGVYWIDESDPAVVALDLETGERRWRSEFSTPWKPIMFASDLAVFVSSGSSDNRVWRFFVENGDIDGPEPRPGGADFPTEQFYQDGSVYAVDAFFGTLHSTPVDDVRVGWSQDVSPGSGAGGGLLTGGIDSVYCTSNYHDAPGLYAVRKTSGSISWTKDIAATITGRPVSTSEVVLVPTNDGVQCYDSASGDHLWTHPNIQQRFVVVDDLIFEGGSGGVRALRAR